MAKVIFHVIPKRVMVAREVIFSRCIGYTGIRERDEMFLIATERYMNHLLKVQGRLTENDFLDALGKSYDRKYTEVCYGWTYGDEVKLTYDVHGIIHYECRNIYRELTKKEEAK